MKICRFDDARIGVVEGDAVIDVSAILDDIGTFRYPLPAGDALIARLDTLRPRLAELAAQGARKPARTVRFLSPVANPTKIIGAPANYRLHIEEAGRDKEISAGRKRMTIAEAGLFLKASSSLVGTSEGVDVRFPDRRTDHEMELAVVIGRRGSDVAEADALSYVAGYTMGLDMVVRGAEDRSLRKSVDSYSVVGPSLVTRDEIADPDALTSGCRSTGRCARTRTPAT